MIGGIALIDYGAGNLHSVANALKAAGAGEVSVTHDPAVVARAERVVLPGVGSFRACAEGLRAIPGLVDAIEARVLGDRVPFLGICVGMQLLATRGVEHGVTEGLGWIPGEVRPIEAKDAAVKIPHMGWNDVSVTWDAGGEPLHPPVIAAGEAYFLHSYQFHADNPAHIAALTEHGESITAAVAWQNIVGVQFHPEKSQAYGLALLARFLKWQP